LRIGTQGKGLAAFDQRIFGCWKPIYEENPTEAQTFVQACRAKPLAFPKDDEFSRGY